jgi:hypothetical protein
MPATSVRRCGSGVKPLRDHADQPPPPELEEMTARGRNRDPCEAREFGWRMRGELAFGAWGGPGASRNHLRGRWDGVVTDQDALAGCSSGWPDRPGAATSRGTHLMHLEEMRTALWRESVAFLLGDDLKRT